jgi:hypothetical protein
MNINDAGFCSNGLTKVASGQLSVSINCQCVQYAGKECNGHYEEHWSSVDLTVSKSRWQLVISIGLGLSHTCHVAAHYLHIMNYKLMTLTTFTTY